MTATLAPVPASAGRALAEARLEAPPAEALIAFYEAPHLEREKRQFAEYVAVDQAHVVMLAEQGILTREEARAILAVLAEIADWGPERFPFDPRRGSFLLQVEDVLFGRIGEGVGGRMHIGRSRLDQGPAVRRLYKRRRLLDVFDGLLSLQAALIDLADRHATTLMPGYTCLQHAHPTVFGHYLLSFVSKLQDDLARLEGAYARLNLNPLGAAGLSGTAWPIDRGRTTELLGFSGILENAKLAREAYYAAEAIAGLSFVMATLNDLATDLHLWSATEFGFVETADALCGTSSIFPQKKNPSGLEAVKFAAGEAVTWLASALATFRAEGTGDVVMREVPLIDRAFEATEGSLTLMTAAVATLTVNQGRMRRGAEESWDTATGLADLLVQTTPLSFRQAHGVIARLVRSALHQGIGPADVSPAMLDAACEASGVPPVRLARDALGDALDAGRFVATRSSRGGTAPAEVQRLLGAARTEHGLGRGRVADRREAVARARDRLRAACQDLVVAGP